MIKLNLLKNRISLQQQGDEDVGADLSRVTRGSQGPGLIVNLALCLGGVFALYLYQVSSLSALEGTLVMKKGQLSVLRENVEKLQKKSVEVKSAQAKLEGIEKRMEIMRGLSESRLEPLKALDHLQTILPDRIWFDKITYSKKQFTFDGFALSDDDFNIFMSRLEKGGIFVNVIPVRFVEGGNKQGKSFTVTSNLRGK